MAMAHASMPAASGECEAGEKVADATQCRIRIEVFFCAAAAAAASTVGIAVIVVILGKAAEFDKWLRGPRVPDDGGSAVHVVLGNVGIGGGGGKEREREARALHPHHPFLARKKRLAFPLLDLCGRLQPNDVFAHPLLDATRPTRH